MNSDATKIIVKENRMKSVIKLMTKLKVFLNVF